MSNTSGILYLPALHDTVGPLIINDIPRGDAIDMIVDFNNRAITKASGGRTTKSGIGNYVAYNNFVEADAELREIGDYVEYNNFVEADAELRDWEETLDTLFGHRIGERAVFFEEREYFNGEASGFVIGNVFVSSINSNSIVLLNNSDEDIHTILEAII